MENNRRLLGWIVLGAGILALLMMLRGGRDWHGDGPPWARGPAPSHWTDSHERPFGPGAFRQGWESDDRWGYQDQAHAAGERHEWRHPGPFFWIGGLFKLLFAGLLILLALKVLRRRSGGPPHPPAAQPGPERPPYTGETQQL